MHGEVNEKNVRDVDRRKNPAIDQRYHVNGKGHTYHECERKNIDLNVVNNAVAEIHGSDPKISKRKYKVCKAFCFVCSLTKTTFNATRVGQYGI